MTAPPIEILTRKQVGERLQVHPAVVGRYVRKHGLPAHRIGRSLRFVRSEVEAWCDAGTWREQKLPEPPPPLPVGGVYFVRAKLMGGLIKIGFSTDVPRRLDQLRAASPVDLELLHVIEGKTMAYEQMLHAKFARSRVHGEWFRRSHGLWRLLARQGVPL